MYYKLSGFCVRREALSWIFLKFSNCNMHEILCPLFAALNIVLSSYWSTILFVENVAFSGELSHSTSTTEASLKRMQKVHAAKTI